ncbi:hypothetical protein MTO98_22850 [Mucilaginibacter sp. SMC90]|uniref:hypothetical protein n=1 Tax=Mucilaginibacter sp. SMC90 TaxID=2929803 RepID=UPI001FB42FB5|nr:hypothetical protein [Mucilaginibacter sp. SMC90]UOE47248.1 hypothetical protein MTO98_22850 [Mucilaginibacter sp. SMC90]
MIIKNVIPLLVLLFLGVNECSYAQKVKSLVPDKPSAATDYFNTWNIQGYVCSYSSTEATRQALNESNLFGDSTYQGWIKFYPKIRKDLIFVMDDSWDIPKSENSGKSKYIGLDELDESRFPSFTGNAEERLTKFVKAVKAAGWKGAGGWISAQKAGISQLSPEAYWKIRMQAANKADFAYLKVDWGRQEHNAEWRGMLTRLGKTYAPHLTIEHAITKESLSFADVYRTYDVQNVIAQPVTIQRIADLISYGSKLNTNTIINCEDEPYIAAGLGCAIGVMRHPFKGDLPDGKRDFAFPPVGRDIKLRVDEVVRGVRWHRIAIPFKVGSKDFYIDNIALQDTWVVGFRDTWGDAKVGNTLKAAAPARISRGLPPAVIEEKSGDQPFVLSSRYPNGAIAIATIGRALNRSYITRRVSVVQQIPGLAKPIGIFGDYQSLTFILPNAIGHGYKFWAQDLAGDTPVDITKRITVSGNKIILSGDIIREVGLSAKTAGDLSDPGLVLVCKPIKH